MLKIIERLSMFEYFSGDEATVIQAILNRFPIFGDEVLLRNINAMLTFLFLLVGGSN